MVGLDQAKNVLKVLKNLKEVVFRQFHWTFEPSSSKPKLFCLKMAMPHPRCGSLGRTGGLEKSIGEVGAYPYKGIFLSFEGLSLKLFQN